MGQWVIIIEGCGAHHNGKTYDADTIAKETVEKLIKEGQKVTHATVSYSGREVIKGQDV